MRVVVVANRGDGDEGYVGERLSSHGAQLVRIAREDFSNLAAALEVGADLVVLLGSDWSVHEPSDPASVRTEQDLVRRAQARGLPVLAICYGAQLVASTLGLTVSRASTAEVGWMTLESDDEARCERGPWFQFHFDRWSDGAVAPSFARSANAPQAFWHGRTLAVQFHPEVTTETARRWLDEQAEVLDAAGLDRAAIHDDSLAFAADARRRCHRLVDDFLSTALAPVTSPI